MMMREQLHTHSYTSKMCHFGREEERALFLNLVLTCACFLLAQTQLSYASLIPFIFHLFEATFQAKLIDEKVQLC